MFANFNFVNNNYNKNNFINNNNNNNNFNNYSNLRYNNSQANIEISYDNYFTNNYYKEIEKEKYANDLRQQIEENKLRKEIEKRKKEEEDLKDELRLIKENQQLELQQKKENNKIISNNNNNINNNIKIIKNNNNNNNNNYFQSFLQQRSNEIKTKDNEIKNLLSSINDTFFHQINRMNFELEKLKEVNLHSNLYKIDLAKSIQDLSNTLHKKNYEQSFKKDSIYKMMIETNKRKLNLQNHLKLNKIPYYDNNNYINLSRSISYNVPRTKPLKELGWYY